MATHRPRQCAVIKRPMTTPTRTIDHKPNLTALAKSYGMTRGTLRTYAAAGVDVEDHAAVAAERKARRLRSLLKISGSVSPEAAADYVRERALKIRADRRRAEVALANELRESLPRAEVAESLMATYRALAIDLDTFARELPPLIAGMDAPGMEPSIRSAVRRLLTHWADNAEAIVSGDAPPFSMAGDR